MRVLAGERLAAAPPPSPQSSDRRGRAGRDAATPGCPAAIVAYLRSLPPVRNRVPARRLSVPARALFAVSFIKPEPPMVYCLTCHGEKGAGSPFTTVPLRDAIRVLDAAAVGGFNTDGLPGTGMPPFGKTLSRDQIADLAAFIRAW